MNQLFRISLICLSVLAFIGWHSKIELPFISGAEQAYISVESGGQLGNQMFHFAAALSYAMEHDLVATFPILNESHNNLSFNRDRLFFRLNTFESPIPLTTYSLLNPNYEKLPSDLQNVQLSGGLFSWKFFDAHRKEIQELYAPSESVLNNLYSKYGDLIARNDTVGVHVRTYSKQIHEEGLHFVGMEYFADTMSQFPENYVFVIFSDRIQWCKASFSKRFPDKDFIFIEGNDHVEDLFLMSLMKHQILSKSTYSWWSAYLNKNSEKKVYAPVKKNLPLPNWVRKAGKAGLNMVGIHPWSNEDYYLPEWNIAYYEVESYPEDIYYYGDESTSVEIRDK